MVKKIKKVTDVSKYIPDTQLQVTKKDIVKAIANSSDDDLHVRYKKLKELYEITTEVIKSEWTKRVKNAFKKTGNKSISLESGKVQLVQKSNYEFDERAIKKLLIRKKIPFSKVFDIDYIVTTKDKSILKELVKKKIVMKNETVSTEKFSQLIEQVPELSKHVTVSYTEYIRM